MRKIVCAAITLFIIAMLASCAGDMPTPPVQPVHIEQHKTEPIAQSNLYRARPPYPTRSELSAWDITKTCSYAASSNPKTLKRAFDGKDSTCWEAKKGKGQYIRISLNEKTTPGSIHITWKTVPAGWKMAVSDQNGASIYTYKGNGWLQSHIELPEGSRSIEIAADNTANLFKVCEITVYTKGKAPYGVQVWQETGKTDLMVVACHPDDEHLYMGGTLPYYAGEKGRSTIVVYMTYGKAERKAEALNGLWAVGVKNYPVFGGFKDKLVQSLEAACKVWGEDKVIAYLAEQIRRYKPKVIVSHDLNGEYGHGAHKLTAKAVLQAITYANDGGMYPDSVAQYGTWQVSKCYLHLYKDNGVKMDWREPLERYGGETALDMAKMGFRCHKSQQGYGFKVLDSGAYDCSKFGLAYTNVGYDTGKNDFFENIQ